MDVMMIYPDARRVDATFVIDWALDLLIDLAWGAHVSAHPHDAGPEAYVRVRSQVERPDLQAAMALLEDEGQATFAARAQRIIVGRMQDTGLRELARRCWPKEQHASREAAEAQKRSILKRGLEGDAKRIHVYRCPHCNAWHVGHAR